MVNYFDVLFKKSFLKGRKVLFCFLLQTLLYLSHLDHQSPGTDVFLCGVRQGPRLVFLKYGYPVALTLIFERTILSTLLGWNFSHTSIV